MVSLANQIMKNTKNKIILISLTIFCLSLFFDVKNISAASTAVTVPIKIPLMTTSEVQMLIQKPTQEINIPGVSFTEPTKLDLNQEVNASGKKITSVYFPYLGEYLTAVYKYAVIVAGVLAVIMIIVSGIMWVISGGNKEMVTSAKKRIEQAVIGLAIISTSYVILYSINPYLVNFKPLKVTYIMPEPIPDENVFTEKEAAAIMKKGVIVTPLGKIDLSSLTYNTPNTLFAKQITLNILNFLTQPSTAMAIGDESTKNIMLGFGDQAITFLMIDNTTDRQFTCNKDSAVALAKILDHSNICVGPNHCAWTASQFLAYLNCQKMTQNLDPNGSQTMSGGATILAKILNSRGWLVKKVTLNNYNKLPVGLLYNGGHVGVSLGGDGWQFQSGSTKFKERIINSASPKCPDQWNVSSKNPSACALCSQNLKSESPSGENFPKDNKGSNQFWFMDKMDENLDYWIGNDPDLKNKKERYAYGWQYIIYPNLQNETDEGGSRINCGGKPNVSKILCDFIDNYATRRPGTNL